MLQKSQSMQYTRTNSTEDSSQRQPLAYQEPLITIEATSTEIIAIGHVIGLYLRTLERGAQPIPEHLARAAALERFQRRVIQTLPTRKGDGRGTKEA